MLHAGRPAFLPIDRRHALAAGTELPDRAHGAVLFADIAGFTTLSRQLTEVLGLRGGVDRLSVVLEDVYGALVAEVHEAGGSVLGFSGDAITCWFDDAPGALEVATPPSGPRRAVACAHRLIEALEALPSVRVGDDRVPLGIKVSRRETSANLGVAVLFALGHYFLTKMIGWLDHYPAYRPDLLLWLPNLIFIGVGIWLFRRIDRS